MNLYRRHLKNTAPTTNGRVSTIDIMALSNSYKTSESFSRKPIGAIGQDIKKKKYNLIRLSSGLFDTSVVRKVLLPPSADSVGEAASLTHGSFVHMLGGGVC